MTASSTEVTTKESTELKAFPPVTDTIDFIKQVDWQEVGQKCRAGVNNCGLVIAVIGEKIHDIGVFFAKV